MDIERLIETFCELVRIPSESPNDKEFIEYLENKFRDMGADCKKDDFGNLVAYFKAKGSTSKESVLFACHADTVKPGIGITPIVDREKGVIRSDGTTILGADDKAGIAEIIEMLRSAKSHPPIEVLITRCEEIGIVGSANLDKTLIKSKLGFVLDLDSCDEIVIGGPSKYAIDFTFIGKGAHASDPELGISAIVPASDAISKLRLGRIDHETTANVGRIEAGTATNSIPEKAMFFAECRSLNHEKAEKLKDEIISICKKSAEKYGVKLEVKADLKYRAYNIAKDSKLVKLVSSYLIKYGFTPKIEIITGGTDASNLNAFGVETIAIGTGARKAHTKEESVIIKEMISACQTIIDLVENFSN